MLEFDVDYFKEETICGFTVPEFMKHAWASQLKLLALVDRICKENDIKYFANWGTILGAVRHKGFIPWDDDIDLCMFRPDFAKFLEVIPNYEGIIVHNCFNMPDFGFHANRVLSGTVYTVERDVYKDYYGFPFPVALDIFNLDYVPRDKALEDEMVEALQVCATAAHAREWLDENGPEEKEYNYHQAEYRVAVNWLEKNCGMQFSSENPDYQEIVILHQEIAGLYGPDDADYVTEVQCLASGNPYYIPKEVYDSVVWLPFENTTIPVPIGYQLLLKMKYGNDYMSPRKVEAGHEYPFYNAYIRAIFNERNHKTFEGACEYIQNQSSRFYIKFLNKTTTPTIGESDVDVNKLTTEFNMSEEEVRELLAKCEVLEEFKRICSKVGIDYYAIGDTLDLASDKYYKELSRRPIEVAIKRDKQNDFLLALGQELGPWFNYATIYANDKYEDMRILIRSDSYRCDAKEFAERFHGCTKEVCLYISIVDNMSLDKEREDTRKMLIDNLIKTSNAVPSAPPYSPEVLSIVGDWENALQIKVDTELNLKREFLRSADNIASATADEDAVNVKIYASLQNGVDLEYERSAFEEAEEVPFFVTTISVPKKNSGASRILDYNELEKKITAKKEVVFLPYKASMWDSLETVWREMDDDPKISALVIPIPYYDKNPDGSVGKMHYEGLEFPEDVPVIDYRSYNIEERHPDAIYVHNPYDEANRITTIHPDYYSSRIYELTDELVYIPYFILGDVDPDNKAALEGIRHLIITNVMKYAHKVIVWSEDWRKAYINVMSDFVGEDTRKYWEKTIVVQESSKLKRVRNLKESDYDMPAEWTKKSTKPDGSKKKIIFYNTGVDPLLKESDKMVDKIERVLQIFKENVDDITLLWRPHPLVEATLTSMRPELWERYKKIVDAYKTEDWGIYDDTAELERAIAVSDAYYGDQSSVVWMYKETGKPIMIQNCEV